MNYWKVAKLALFLINKCELKTGGKTGCDKCKCYIENDVYYAYYNTKRKCSKCNHFISDHHMFL